MLNVVWSLDGSECVSIVLRTYEIVLLLVSNVLVSLNALVLLITEVK